ncbi:MAG: FAD-dependent oxidoreductase [Cyanobacteria bacterium HKST-UBA02]|nr:FAD-dependent oxidoreductase [Cyanobacteria bacterium HKST-UBA02]
MADREKKKIVIVGGVAGGMSAAARARRLSEEAEIIVLERSGYVSFANCGLPYYLGREIESRDKLLVQTPETLKKKFNLDVRVLSEVTAIDPESKKATIKNLTTGEIYEESYDDLILAVGASPLRPPIPGIDRAGVFTLRTIEDVETIDRWIEEKRPASVVVAGGGFIGIEMAEQLARRGMKVTLVDASDHVLVPLDTEMAELVHLEMERNGIKLVLASPIKEMQAPETRGGITPQSCWVVAGEQPAMAADLVIMGLGIRPEIALARQAGLATGERNGIRVDERLMTSAEHIWAVGDAIEVVHPVGKNHTLIALGGPANRQGRIVADNIFGGEQVYKGTLGTAILRVFDLAVAMTGLNEKQVRMAGIDYETVSMHPSHHAGYFPGAGKLAMKVIFRRESGELLGAQVIGREGADKRIDVLATAMKAGMTVRDLAELELAYAPPFGSAKDPINLLGMAGCNLLDGLVSQIRPEELDGMDEKDYCVIDVRSAGEREAGFVPGSLHIALPELRQSLDRIPENKTVIVYCQSGQRAYYACRFLSQKGYDVKNLSGGYLTYRVSDTAGGGNGNLFSAPAVRSEVSTH